jgi:hypothetical protein
MAEDKGTALDWGMESVDDAGGAGVLLPAGVYRFTVMELKREYFQGSAKANPCPRAHLVLKVDGGEHGTGIVHDRIMLSTKSAWVISRLFASCGFPKLSDGHQSVKWDGIEGKTGWAEFGQREYKGKVSNEVQGYIPADDAPKQESKAAGAWD